MSDIAERLRAACNGHPHAKIPWPHRVLHEAADEIERLRAIVSAWEKGSATARWLREKSACPACEGTGIAREQEGVDAARDGCGRERSDRVAPPPPLSTPMEREEVLILREVKGHAGMRFSQRVDVLQLALEEIDTVVTRALARKGDRG